MCHLAVEKGDTLGGLGVQGNNNKRFRTVEANISVPTVQNPTKDSLIQQWVGLISEIEDNLVTITKAITLQHILRNKQIQMQVNSRKDERSVWKS